MIVCNLHGELNVTGELQRHYDADLGLPSVQVQYLYAMAAWSNNLQLTLTGTVRGCYGTLPMPHAEPLVSQCWQPSSSAHCCSVCYADARHPCGDRNVYAERGRADDADAAARLQQSRFGLGVRVQRLPSVQLHPARHGARRWCNARRTAHRQTSSRDAVLRRKNNRNGVWGLPLIYSGAGAQQNAFVLDNICYNVLPVDQWPAFSPAPPAVPSSCADDLLTFDDIRNLGELCATQPMTRSAAQANQCPRQQWTQ